MTGSGQLMQSAHGKGFANVGLTLILHALSFSPVEPLHSERSNKFLEKTP
jgi:hypothetical protein